MNTSTLQRAALAYRSVQVTTASPAQMLVLLYDAAIRFLREARAAHARDDRTVWVDRITRANAIIDHLMGTIDPSHLPSLAERLTGLYAYAMRRLIEANATRNTDIVEEVERLLVPLRDAWATAAGQVRPR